MLDDDFSESRDLSGDEPDRLRRMVEQWWTEAGRNQVLPLMDGFRRVLLHGRWPEWAPVGVSAAVSALLLVLAYAWYKRVDPRFADVI